MLSLLTVFVFLPLIHLINSAKKGESCGFFNRCTDDSECNFNKCLSKEELNTFKNSILISPIIVVCDLFHWCNQGYQCQDSKCIEKEDIPVQQVATEKEDIAVKQVAIYSKGKNRLRQQIKQEPRIDDKENELEEQTMQQQEDPFEEVEMNDEKQTDDQQDETMHIDAFDGVDKQIESDLNMTDETQMQEPILQEPMIVYGDQIMDQLEGQFQQKVSDEHSNKFIAKINAKKMTSNETGQLNNTIEQISNDLNVFVN